MQFPNFFKTTDVRAATSAQRAITLTVNGQFVEKHIQAHMSLAELLRDELKLMGTKIACNQAACGACTVLVDGQAIFACHTLAAQLNGASIVTVEGLSGGLAPDYESDSLHPLQRAFIEHDAMQCGFCTPGMIMALKAAIDSGVTADRAAIAKAISGNLCRCGAYEQILDAAIDVIAQQGAQ